MGLPCGTLNETYRQDMAIVRTRLQWGLLLVFLVLLFLLPKFLNDYLLSIINGVAIWLIAVFGLNLLTGYCGQINLGQAAFMAVGGYTSAILATRFGLSFWVVLPASAVVAGLVGMLFGLPALRVKGFYLAMTTLAAQFIVTWVIIHGGDITQRTYGISLPRPNIFGFAFNNETRYFYLIIPFALLMGFFARNLARTRVGRAFVAIRDNDLAAEVMGVNLFYYKTLAFVICAAYAGVAGSLWTYYLGVAHYEHYALMDSVWMLGMLIVGGMGSTMGVVFGTIFIRGLNEAVTYRSSVLSVTVPSMAGSAGASLGLVTLGLVIILFLIFEPRGINHRWEITKHTYRIFPFSY